MLKSVSTKTVFNLPLDQDLIVLIGAGDESALRQFIDRHKQPVYETIVKMLGDANEAEDLAQQVFVRVYHSAGSFNVQSDLKPWLYTIVRNLVLNELRRRSRSRLFFFQSAKETSLSESQILNIPDPSTQNNERQDHNRDRIRQINETMQHLTEDQRMALVLYGYAECSYEEIAAIMKTSIASVTSLLARAREKLRKLLKS